MTKVTVYRWHTTEIRVEGHAEPGPGQNVVCAACSILAYTLLDCLSEEEKAGHITMEYKLQDGLFWAKYAAVDAEAAERSAIVLRTILAGYKLLEQYGVFVEEITA